ncbi:MAG: hypothetical protein HYX63_16560 [Gammaproteobacteria bacterium]|nr:hypothetical protein [Gammaproteobacteria bacterium]
MAKANVNRTTQPDRSDEIVELVNLVQFVLDELEEKIEDLDDENYYDRRAVCLALVKGILDIPDQIIGLAKSDDLEALFERRYENLATQAAREASTAAEVST